MARYDFKSQRLFLRAGIFAGARIPLAWDQANYLVNVLRMAELAIRGEYRTLLTGKVGLVQERKARLREFDRVVLDMSAEERQLMADRAREHALSFDRVRVFDSLFATSNSAVVLTG